MIKNRFLVFINLILGSLSILLAGCHSQKKAAQPAEPEDNTQIEQPADSGRVVCMYGVPAEIYERPMMKYGTPNMRDKKKK